MITNQNLSILPTHRSNTKGAHRISARKESNIAHIEDKTIFYKDGKDSIYSEFIPTLKKRPKAQKLKTFISADVETLVYNNKHYVIMIYFAYYDSHGVLHQFGSNIDHFELEEDLSNISTLSEQCLLNFWERLNTLEIKSIIYLHNMSKFDGVFILQLMSLLLKNKIIKDSDIKIIDRNNVFYEINMAGIKFRDSYQLLPSSLDSLAKSFLNESKLEIDYNFTFETVRFKFDSIIKYCMQDVRLLLDVLTKFQQVMLKLFDIDCMRCMTISSLAFKLIRTNYIQDNTIENSNGKTNITSFIQQSYRGGYSCVINPMSDGHNLTGIDRNSSYPAAMCLDLPVGLGTWSNKESLIQINNNKDNINNIFGFIDATIIMSDANIISPLITVYDGKLCDLTGNIRVVLFSEELKFIIANGGVISDIHAVLNYNRGQPLKEFAESLFDERLKTDDATMKFIFKLILNSSFGRWSINDANTRINIVNNEMKAEYERNFEVASSTTLSDEFSMCTLLVNNIKQESKSDVYNKQMGKSVYTSHKAIQISSSIASYARIALIQQAYDITKLGGKIYYMDTDSVFFSGVNIDNILNINNKLGGWKITNQNTKGIFIQPKFYIMLDLNNEITVKIKGIPKDTLYNMCNTLYNKAISMGIRIENKTLFINEHIWKMFQSRYAGNTMFLNVDKHFIRSLHNLAIETKSNVEYSLKPNIHSKRQHIYAGNMWVSTKSYKVQYNYLNRSLEDYKANSLNRAHKLESEINRWLIFTMAQMKTQSYFKFKSVFITINDLIQFLRSLDIKDLNLNVLINFQHNNFNKVVSTKYSNIAMTIDSLQKYSELYDDIDVMEISAIFTCSSKNEFQKLYTNIIIYNLNLLENIILEYKVIQKLFINTIKDILKINSQNLYEQIYWISENIVRSVYNIVSDKLKVVNLKHSKHIFNSQIINKLFKENYNNDINRKTDDVLKNLNVIKSIKSLNILRHNINFTDADIVDETIFVKEAIIANVISAKDAIPVIISKAETLKSQLDMELLNEPPNRKLINKLRAHLRYYKKLRKI